MKNSRTSKSPTRSRGVSSKSSNALSKASGVSSSLMGLSSMQSFGSTRSLSSRPITSMSFRASSPTMRRNVFVESPHLNPRLEPQLFYKKLTEVVLSKEVLEARRAAEAKKMLAGELAEVKIRRKMGAEKKYYVEWIPHPRLAKTNDVQRLSHYLYDHSQRLKWYQSKITKLSRHHSQRAPWRKEINKEKKAINYIQNKINELSGTPKYKRLIPENAPQFEHHSPFVHELAVVQRIPRDYDYPGKEIYEPLARAQAAAASDADTVKIN